MAAEDPSLISHRADDIEDIPFPDWATSYLMAWETLRDDRSIGFRGSPYGIWYSSLSRYVKDAGVPRRLRQSFIYFVSVLDQEYLSVVAERMKTDTPSPE